jgi:hypothetical protein
MRDMVHRHYRMVVCDAIGRDWNDELAWVTRMGPGNAKNYQIWFVPLTFYNRQSCS